MPTYDYKCRACEHRFEAFQSMTEEPKRKCPACGKMTLVRLVGTGAGIIFKGSGFYETDYKRRHATPGGKPEGAKEEKPVPASCPAKECPAKKECPAAKTKE